MFVCRCETDYVRLYLDVDNVGVNELTDWTVELCGNSTTSNDILSNFYSSTSRAIIELHTSHRHRLHLYHHYRQQQQQYRSRRPRFGGFRGTFRFVQKGQRHAHINERFLLVKYNLSQLYIFMRPLHRRPH